MKKELICYYKALYDEGECYNKIRMYILYTTVLLLLLIPIASIYSLISKSVLIFALIFAAVLQFLLWYTKYKMTNSYAIAHDFQRYVMLINYSPNSIDYTKIEAQKRSFSSFVRKKFNSKINEFEGDDCKDNKEVLAIANLRRQIHENSYFNECLFQYCYSRNIKVAYFFAISIFILLFSFIVGVDINQDFVYLSSSLIQILYTLLSLGILYEFLDSTFKYRSTIEDMRSIDRYLTKSTKSTSEVILDAFAKYNEAKSATPNIPEMLYYKHKNELNNGWRSRQADLIIELCDLFEGIDESWAITGSMNHYLRGMVDGFGDLDIITTRQGGSLISDKLKNYIHWEYSFKEGDKIKSYFGIFEYRGLQVEIMGDPENLINGEWEENNEWKEKVESISFNGSVLPLTTLDYEILIYGRLGNSEVASKLREFKEGRLKQKKPLHQSVCNISQ